MILLVFNPRFLDTILGRC